MSLKFLIDLFKKSFVTYLKNPYIIVPSVFLWIFIIAFSSLSVKLNYILQNTFLLSTWLVVFSILILLIISFFFSGLIGLCFLSIKRQSNLADFFKYSKKFWLKNFIVIITILMGINIIRFISHNIGIIVGQSLALDVKIATGLFFILYFGGIIGFLIFFSFSSVYLVSYDFSILKSIKKSFGLVKSNYIETLIILTLYFVISQILEKNIPRLGVEIINAFFIVPYFAVLLVRFVYGTEGK
jgi:hypothetical protein